MHHVARCTPPAPFVSLHANLDMSVAVLRQNQFLASNRIRALLDVSFSLGAASAREKDLLDSKANWGP